jgi:hypothetical protein
MIRFIFRLGIGLATFVALAVAFFRTRAAGCGRATGRGARSSPLPAASLPEPVAGKCSSLLAAPEIRHKQLIILVIIGRIRTISALE